uniref:DUF5672 domain-containing protein n=1 Tax=viral metagenome TaxID=1070528 RepID=A0A6C0JK99_9ZZZZ
MNKLIYLLLFIVFAIVLFYYLFNNRSKEGFNEKYTAIIVEPREHKALSFVLKNALTNLPNNWNIVIMYGNKNKDFVMKIIDTDLSDYRERITTKNLNVDNLTISEYNDLLTSKEFYDNVPTEIFLIFQTDSVICNENKDLLDDFMKYDYVGAPWKDAVGNGGFSLRRKSKVLEIISKCKRGKGNEDVYFANPCISNFKPSIEKAKTFSVEGYYSDKSFGVHKPWAYLDEEELDKKIKQCSPLKQLWELNS